MAGRFACSSKRDVSNVKVDARLVELGKNLLTNLTSLISGAFGEKNYDFAKFLICTLGN